MAHLSNGTFMWACIRLDYHLQIFTLLCSPERNGVMDERRKYRLWCVNWAVKNMLAEKEQECNDECGLCILKENKKKRNLNFSVFNNPSSHFSIDFWVYEVHLIAPWHPCQRPRTSQKSGVDFRFYEPHLNALWSLCPCVSNWRRQQPENSVPVSDTNMWLIETGPFLVPTFTCQCGGYTLLAKQKIDLHLVLGSC